MDTDFGMNLHLLELSDNEKSILRCLQKGIARIEVYKAGGYPDRVCLLSQGGTWLTLQVRCVDIGPRFEVFPISVSQNRPESSGMHEIDATGFNGPCVITILRKSEWTTPCTEEEKRGLIGDASNATIQHEGSPEEAPEGSVTLDAGIDIKDASGGRLLVATSMFPYALCVSGCDFSEIPPSEIYEFSLL